MCILKKKRFFGKNKTVNGKVPQFFIHLDRRDLNTCLVTSKLGSLCTCSVPLKQIDFPTFKLPPQILPIVKVNNLSLRILQFQLGLDYLKIQILSFGRSEPGRYPGKLLYIKTEGAKSWAPWFFFTHLAADWMELLASLFILSQRYWNCIICIVSYTVFFQNGSSPICIFIINIYINIWNLYNGL